LKIFIQNLLSHVKKPFKTILARRIHDGAGAVAVVLWALAGSKPRSSLARENNFSNEKLLRILGRSFLVGCDMLIICPSSDTEHQQTYQVCVQPYAPNER
jgi:hypothetical protein